MMKSVYLRFSIAALILMKGGEDMMAMFFAQRIILGKIKFSRVPDKLKPRVREILVECGCEDLIDDEAAGKE